MAYKVVWTRKAREQRTEMLNYGARTFGKKQALKFRDLLHKYDRLLTTNPYLGSIEPLLIHEPQMFRSIVFHKNHKLVYNMNTATNMVYIVALWDTRREPQQQAGQTK